MVMNIVLYGVSAEIAGKIAGKYGLKLISTPDKFQPSGSVVQYCTPPGKFFSLGGDLEPEELESELYVILDSLFAEGNQINF